MIKLTKWQLQRGTAWCLPLIFLVVLFATLEFRFRQEAGERLFPGDEPYRHLVMARSIQTAQAYHWHASAPIPMVGDVAWRGLLALGVRRLGDDLTVALLFGLAGVGLSLLLLQGLAERLFPYPVCIGFTAAYALLTPLLYRASFSGTSQALAMVLIVAAVQRHIADLARRGRGLPFSATVLIAMAMWVRVELVVVWLALWLHTGALAWLPGEERLSPMAVALRGLNGLLFLALCTLPMLAWNQRVVEVPWPRLPHAPLAADIWIEAGPAAGWHATSHWMQMGVSEVAALWRNAVLPGGPISVVLAVIGMVLIAGQARHTERFRHYTVLGLLPLVAWVLWIPLYPYMGGSSGPVLAVATAPFLLLLAAYGVVYLPFQFGNRLLHRLPGWSERRLFAGWWGVAGTLLLGEALISQATFVRNHTATLRNQAETRRAISDILLAEGLNRDRFITDQPGWLVWQHRVAVVDLTGEWSPRLLASIDAEGGFDLERLTHYLGHLRHPPTAALLWAPAHQVHTQWLAEPQQLWPPPDAAPGQPLLVIDATAGVL